MRIAGLGLPELLIILLVVLLIFGASRLPGVGSALGKGIRSFKTSVTGEDDKPAGETASDDRTQGDQRT